MSKHRDADWLKEELVVKRRTMEDIGEECGVTREAVRQMAKKHGIVKPRQRDLIDIDWLSQERGVKHRSLADLAVEIGVGTTAISDVCRQHGITGPPQQTPEEVAARMRARCKKYYHRMFENSLDFRAMKKARSIQWQQDNPERYNAYQRSYLRRKRVGLDSGEA